MSQDPYAGIAAIYDRWCAEVTEDVPFYRMVCGGAQEPVIEIRGDKVRLGIEAPKDVTVHRREVYEAIQAQNTSPPSPGSRDREPDPSPIRPEAG